VSPSHPSGPTGHTGPTGPGAATPRAILHVDMDAFFASVEQLDDPELRGRPVLVGHDGPRGVVAAASYEARRFGCRSAMPMATARRLCPEAVVVRGRGRRYAEVSRRVFAILGDFTPLVQPLSIDEAFLDVTGSVRLLGEPLAMAREIRRRIREQEGLVASIGIAPNKFLAKLASDLEKPDGLVELSADDVTGRLAELPVERLWGVGGAAARRLHAMGLRSFGDLQRLSDADAATLGEEVCGLRRLAMGIDERPVHPDREAKSIGSERTFGVDLSRPADATPFLIEQAEEVAERLRRHGRLARTVTVKIRSGDYQTLTRSRTLREPTDLTDEVIAAARELFAAWAAASFRPLRLVGTSLSNLVEPEAARQRSLFAPEQDERRRRLDAATDDIRRRFGTGAIGRGERATGD
jgi:DNA polymerase-4